MKTVETQALKVCDPVCGMQIDPAAADLFEDRDNHTYFFCTDRCRSKFLTNPNKYIDDRTAVKPRKGWWGRYLDRVQKATGGNPPKCCS